jgi:hypothetical protein
VGRDVFISHASEDKATAFAVCKALEDAGVSCWIAPRDLPGGSEYAAALLDAIVKCRLLVLIHSTYADRSVFIKREVERAVKYKKIILTFRLEKIEPSLAMEFFLCTTQWIDAFDRSLGVTTNELVESIRFQLNPQNRKDDGSSRGGQLEENVNNNHEPDVASDNRYLKELERYRIVLETAWADRQITAGEMDFMEEQTRILGLPIEMSSALEREVLGKTVREFRGLPSSTVPTTSPQAPQHIEPDTDAVHHTEPALDGAEREKIVSDLKHIIATKRKTTSGNVSVGNTDKAGEKTDNTAHDKIVSRLKSLIHRS